LREQNKGRWRGGGRVPTKGKDMEERRWWWGFITLVLLIVVIIVENGL